MHNPYGYQERLIRGHLQAGLVTPGAAADSDAGASEEPPRGYGRMKRAKACGECPSGRNPRIKKIWLQPPPTRRRAMVRPLRSACVLLCCRCAEHGWQRHRARCAGRPGAARGCTWCGQSQNDPGKGTCMERVRDMPSQIYRALVAPSGGGLSGALHACPHVREDFAFVLDRPHRPCSARGASTRAPQAGTRTACMHSACSLTVARCLVGVGCRHFP